MTHLDAAFRYECHDCTAATQLQEITPGVHVLAVVHEDTCPAMRAEHG